MPIDSAPVPTRPASSFAEIRALIPHLGGPDVEAGTAAALRGAARGGAALGRLAELARFLAAWQGKRAPKLDRPRIAVFAAAHGFARHLGLAADATASRVQALLDGEAPLNQLSTLADADLRAYEMALDRPTQDFTTQPAMSEQDCAHAMAYGMMAVEPGLDLLCLGAAGEAAEIAAAALCAGLTGEAISAWASPDAAALTNQAVNLHRDAVSDPLEALRRLGGPEIAALCGAILAARLAHLPVVLESLPGLAAGAVVRGLDVHALDHCLIAQPLEQPGARRMLEGFAKKPVLDFAIRQGEGCAAALTIPLLRAAVATHTGGSA